MCIQLIAIRCHLSSLPRAVHITGNNNVYYFVCAISFGMINNHFLNLHTQISVQIFSIFSLECVRVCRKLSESTQYTEQCEKMLYANGAVAATATVTVAVAAMAASFTATVLYLENKSLIFEEETIKCVDIYTKSQI